MGKKVSEKFWLFLAMFGLVVCMMFTTSKQIAWADTGTDKVYVQNSAGAYLKKIENAWYYFNEEEQIITGIQYVDVTQNNEITSGFYMFAANGRMIQEQVLYNLKEQVVAGVTFKGYHITDASGCFVEKEHGLDYFTSVRYKTGIKKLNNYFYVGAYGRMSREKAGLRFLSRTTVDNKTFSAGYYYFNVHGRLNNKAGLRYMSQEKIGARNFKSGFYYFTTNGRLNLTTGTRRLTKCTVNGQSFASGYYYFNNGGRLNRTKAFRSVNTKINGVTLKGIYYFGDTNARVLRKAGWVTYNGERYYIERTGKRAANCWKDGYYLLEDGTVAKNMQLPDGTFVNWYGEVCSSNEMNFEQLRSNVQRIVSKYSGSWSVYVKELKSGEVLNLNDKKHYPASTIKAFVMASIYDQINKGNIAYTSTIKSYLKSMITVSDNEAYNQLIKRQTNSLDFKKGFSIVNLYLEKNGYKSTECHTTLSPSYTGYRSDGLGTNKTSAKDCGLLLERIYKGTCVNKAYSKEMLNLLLAQERTWKIPYTLPSNIKVANKTGETSSVQHDIAIVYGPKSDYVICVFASGVSEYYGIKGIQEVSKSVYNFLN